MLILELKLSPEYVLDKMEIYEVKAFIKYKYFIYKEAWEQTRMLSYIIAACNSTKKLKITDIIKFPWDNTDKAETNIITQKDIDRLQRKAEEYLKTKQN